MSPGDGLRWIVHDGLIHLVLSGGLLTRCGQNLPPEGWRVEQPPPPELCPRCRQIFLGLFAATGVGMGEKPDVAAALRLIDVAKARGFSFERTGPGEDAPVLGVRESAEFIDEIVLAGFWQPESCSAVRRRRSSLVVPGGSAVTQRISGDALTVLRTVTDDWAP